MIHFLYDMALWLAAPFIISYHLVRSVQRNRPTAFAARFGAVTPEELALLDGERPIWVHAVSVGETIAVRPFLKALKKRFPERKIALSNITETGRSVAMTYPEIDLCLYFPFDYRFAARRLLSRINPALVLIVETEIWPNFLRTAHEMNIPTVLVNGRISDRSFGRYHRMRWFFSGILHYFSRLCMQTAEDARRIIAIGAPADRVGVTKNLKFDLPVTFVSPDRKAEMRASFGISASVPVFTAGSTHPGEEEPVVGAYRQLVAAGHELLLVLAPRHPERVPQVAELLRREGLSFTVRTRLNDRTESFKSGEVLLVDTVGELMQFYALSDLAFVGGSLVATGGHNILEPASLRVPVLFGPHMNNFREASALILACGGGCQLNDDVELTACMAALLEDEPRRRAMGENGARLMEQNSGATLLNLEVVERLLENS